MPETSSAASTNAAQRAVIRVVRGIPASDGAGVRLTRVIGQPGLSELDPFLLLDESVPIIPAITSRASPSIRIATLKPSPI